MWVFYNMTKLQSGTNTVEVCMMKYVTNIPCPSCGSTRSVLSLLHGNFIQALNINPLGIIIAVIMLIAPIWIFFDVVTHKKTLLDFYIQTEAFLKKPKIAISLVLFVLINWIWNIIKEL
jgi:hypothetical protein